MNRQHAKKHTGRRVLAVLLSLLMLLQSVSALAGSVDVPETSPAETASVPAETADFLIRSVFSASLIRPGKHRFYCSTFPFHGQPLSLCGGK